MAAAVVVVDARHRPGRAAAGDSQRWASLAGAVLADEGVTAGELGLRFVDSAEMALLNSEHMGAHGPTDVLAFPLDGADSEPSPVPSLIGDVTVCPAFLDASPDAPAGRGADPANADNRAGRADPGSSAGRGADPDPANADNRAGRADEIALLVVHGLLHVLGYDHADDADAAVMRARERELLAAHHPRR